MGGRDEGERMVLPMVLLLFLKKIVVAPWLWCCCREARKVGRLLSVRGLFHKRWGNIGSTSSPASSLRSWLPSSSPQSKRRTGYDGDDASFSLLKSSSPFPYFMLVAFEGGGLPRAATLLLAYPIIWLLLKTTPCSGLGIRFMAFITFCGLRTTSVGLVARAVLPKFLMDDLNLCALDAMKEGKKVVVSTCGGMPRVLMESFMKDHLALDEVTTVLAAAAPELHTITGDQFYSGRLSFKHATYADGSHLATTKTPLVFSAKGNKESQGSACAKIRLVDKMDADREDEPSAAANHPMIKKPVVFHDGRLALFPTPSAILAVFLWLPFGTLLGILRAVLAINLPYNLGLPVNAALGLTVRAHNPPAPPPSTPTETKPANVLYACTHRTLLDPVALSTALKRPVTAVTYSLSRFSELVSPIHTVRLTRDRIKDGETMRSLLSKGDLAVCPEGTTCREPFLLRFSPLFAEVSDRIVPVAVDTEVGMFYGTTATGRKCLDPLLFLMNPAPKYWVNFLDEVPPELTCGGSAGKVSSRHVANRIQKQLAEALRFKCTNLTRKDKYMMLAGNQGLVGPSSNSGVGVVHH